MSKTEDFMELIKTKNESLELAANALETFMQPCVEGETCEKDADTYHWRGCPTNLKPLIDNLRAIAKAT